MASTKWTFCVVLWDETGNIKLERKIVSVRRVCQFVAKDYVKRQFSSKHFVELDSSSK